MRAVCAASIEGALPAVVSHDANVPAAPVDTRTHSVRANPQFQFSQFSKSKQDQD
jgi:hypothetical protein